MTKHNEKMTYGERHRAVYEAYHALKLDPELAAKDPEAAQRDLKARRDKVHERHTAIRDEFVADYFRSYGDDA